MADTPSRSRASLQSASIDLLTTRLAFKSVLAVLLGSTSSMNLERRLGAWMRVDAAATRPGFGGLCHQLIHIAGCVK